MKAPWKKEDEAKIVDKMLYQRLAEMVAVHNKNEKKNKWSVQVSDRGRTVITIYEVGKDYIFARDKDGRDLFISLNGGLQQIRDVTDNAAFEHEK